MVFVVLTGSNFVVLEPNRPRQRANKRQKEKCRPPPRPTLTTTNASLYAGDTPNQEKISGKRFRKAIPKKQSEKPSIRADILAIIEADRGAEPQDADSVDSQASNPSDGRLSDARLAVELAAGAGERLRKLRTESQLARYPWALSDQADQLANTYIVEQLTARRPSDAVMSEETPDDPSRLDHGRCWIVDPLDGSSDYPYPDSVEWAIHVALVENGEPVAAAVAVPGLGQVFATDTVTPPGDTGRDQPLIVTSRSNTVTALAVAHEIDAKVSACGSAGVKAMLVVDGTVDVYIHATGLWEWDVCAPAAVAAKAGLVVSDLAGNDLRFNKPNPAVQGFVVSRPEFAQTIQETLTGLRKQ